MFRKFLVSLVVMLGLSGTSAMAAHPVLHLSGGKQDSLQYSYKYNYNDTQIDQLYEWCFLNCEAYTADRLQEENFVTAESSTNLRNFALAYAIYPYAGNSQIYGFKAASLVNSLVMDPPGSCTSLADWLHRTHYYTARNVLYSYACVYDWTYDLMTPQQQYNVRRALVVTAKRFYHDAHESTEAARIDSAYGSNRPHSNYNYGEVLGYLAAVLAVKEDTSAVDHVYTYLIDTMCVEMKKAVFGGSFIAAYRNYGNLVGRDTGGMHMESTKYSAEDNEMFGCIVDIVSRYADISVSAVARDYFQKSIMAQIYGTYPGKPFNGLGKMFGEGRSGDGVMGVEESAAITWAANLCSASDTAGTAKWWLSNYGVGSDAAHLATFVLADIANITANSDFTPAQSYYLSGPQYLFIRGGDIPLNELEDNMLLTFRGGVTYESTAHPGFGNITWYKGGFGIAEPALLRTDNTQLFINDMYHNTVSVDTCADGYKSFSAIPYGASTLEHSNTDSSYIYYAFDFTTPYTSQETYICNTVKHKEREFLYIPEDTLLFLFDRVSTYNTRRDPDSFTTVPHVYPITWNLYTEGSATVGGNTGFTITPSYGSFKLAGLVADPSTNLYRVGIDEVTAGNANTSVLRYRPWATDSTMLIASALWMNTQATPDSLYQVLIPHGNMFGLGASAVTPTNDWIEYVAMFATDMEGDTGSVWGSGDSITIAYGRPADSVNVFLFNMSSKVDSFVYKFAIHRADTLLLRVKRTKSAGYTRCVTNTAGVVKLASASTGGTLPPDPPPPPPPTGGKTHDLPEEFILPLLIPVGKRKRILAILRNIVLIVGISAGSVFGQSGMKYDCTNASGTKYFIDINGNNFFASTLWIKLDSDASGPLTVYRKTLAAVQIDSTNAIVLEPGESYSLPAVGARGFAYTKTTATDCMRYLPLAEGEVYSGGDAYITPTPIPVTVGDPIEIHGIANYIPTQTHTRTWPTLGVNVDGARAVLLCADWNCFDAGRFVIQPIFSSISGDSGVTNIIDGIDSTSVYRNFFGVDSVAGAIDIFQSGVGKEALILRLNPPGGGLFQGFLYARLTVYDVTNIKGFRMWVVREY